MAFQPSLNLTKTANEDNIGEVLSILKISLVPMVVQM